MRGFRTPRSRTSNSMPNSDECFPAHRFRERMFPRSVPTPSRRNEVSRRTRLHRRHFRMRVVYADEGSALPDDAVVPIYEGDTHSRRRGGRSIRRRFDMKSSRRRPGAARRFALSGDGWTLSSRLSSLARRASAAERILNDHPFVIRELLPEFALFEGGACSPIHLPIPSRPMSLRPAHETPVIHTLPSSHPRAARLSSGENARVETPEPRLAVETGDSPTPPGSHKTARPSPPPEMRKAPLL